MRALIQTAYGEPQRVLELQERPDEVPDTGEVVVAMEAAAVHVADLHTIAGREGFRKPLPRTPGYDGVGRVIAVGEGVTNVKTGDRVLPPLGSGTHREQLKTPAEGVVLAPEGDATQLALLTVSPAAAFLMLQSFVKLAQGDWIIQNAANSSVGRVILQLAHELKLRLVNVVKSPEVAAELQEEGATVVLIDDADLIQRVAAATQGAAIRLGLDAVGGDATARIAGCLGEGGILINYGAMSGKPCEIPYGILAARDLRLVGFNSSRQLARCSADERKALYERVGALLSSGGLRAKPAAVYPIEEAMDAYDHAKRVGDKRVGKVVIRYREVPLPPSR
jgi:NADPH:quinone reductase-like Zn-dependent oxidoreductase